MSFNVNIFSGSFITLCLFVLAFQQQEALLQTSKVEIEFSMLFGLVFSELLLSSKINYP